MPAPDRDARNVRGITWHLGHSVYRDRQAASLQPIEPQIAVDTNNLYTLPNQPTILYGIPCVSYQYVGWYISDEIAGSQQKNQRHLFFAKYSSSHISSDLRFFHPVMHVLTRCFSICSRHQSKVATIPTTGKLRSPSHVRRSPTCGKHCTFLKVRRDAKVQI